MKKLIRFIANTNVADYVGLAAMGIAHLEPHSDRENYIYASIGAALFAFAAALVIFF